MCSFYLSVIFKSYVSYFSLVIKVLIVLTHTATDMLLIWIVSHSASFTWARSVFLMLLPFIKRCVVVVDECLYIYLSYLLSFWSLTQVFLYWTKFNTHHPEESCVSEVLVLVNGREHAEDQTGQNNEKPGEGRNAPNVSLLKTCSCFKSDDSLTCHST